LGVHVTYLRDRKRGNYDNGIHALAPNLAGTVQALRKLIADLGVQRVVCYGNSLGSYGALRYALELHADAVLTFAGATNLTLNFARPLGQRGIAPGVDLRPLYQDASDPPRAHLVYAEHQLIDRTQAEHFRGLPTVTLEMALGATNHFSCLH